jgi:hypothetical protein
MYPEVIPFLLFEKQWSEERGRRKPLRQLPKKTDLCLCSGSQQSHSLETYTYTVRNRRKPNLKK